MIDPKKDGIDHINIYSKAKTSLGLFLSNFTECDLETEDGDFCSIEGYWYWLLSFESKVDFSNQRNNLRTLSGYQAKTVGKSICEINCSDNKNEDFVRKIKQAIRYKIENSNYLTRFRLSTLPFAHYYVYDDKVIIPSEQWVIQYIEHLRKEYGNMSSL